MKLTQRHIDITTQVLRGATLQATWQVHGIGKERVRQIVARALRITFGIGPGSLQAEIGSPWSMSKADLHLHADRIISRMEVRE